MLHIIYSIINARRSTSLTHFTFCQTFGYMFIGYMINMTSKINYSIKIQLFRISWICQINLVDRFSFEMDLKEGSQNTVLIGPSAKLLKFIHVFSIGPIKTAFQMIFLGKTVNWIQRGTLFLVQRLVFSWYVLLHICKIYIPGKYQALYQEKCATLYSYT